MLRPPGQGVATSEPRGAAPVTGGLGAAALGSGCGDGAATCRSGEVAQSTRTSPDFGLAAGRLRRRRNPGRRRRGGSRRPASNEISPIPRAKPMPASQEGVEADPRLRTDSPGSWAGWKMEPRLGCAAAGFARSTIVGHGFGELLCLAGDNAVATILTMAGPVWARTSTRPRQLLVGIDAPADLRHARGQVCSLRAPRRSGQAAGRQPADRCSFP